MASQAECETFARAIASKGGPHSPRLRGSRVRPLPLRLTRAASTMARVASPRARAARWTCVGKAIELATARLSYVTISIIIVSFIDNCILIIRHVNFVQSRRGSVYLNYSLTTGQIDTHFPLGQHFPISVNKRRVVMSKFSVAIDYERASSRLTVYNGQKLNQHAYLRRLVQCDARG